jgi:HD-GYP domain-containing protein (c-di-GMP phosphodiesterase class II)
MIGGGGDSMTESFPGWTAEVQRSFKEVLFRFLEEVHCTKAALYLLAPDGSYGLMAQYGFGRRDHLPVEHQAQDVIVLKARELRTKPWALNHSQGDPEFGEHLSSAGTNRMMLVPLHGASRVLGFVDARDKGGKCAFETVDLQQGAIIVDELLDLARGHGLFPDLVADAAAPDSPGSPALREPDRINEQAGEALLDEYGLQDLDEALMDTITHDAVFAIAMTVSTAAAASTVVYSGASTEDVDRGAITRHQAEALVRARRSTPHHSSWKVELRRVASAADAVRASVIATAVPISSAEASVVLSVVGAEGGDAPGMVLERVRKVASGAQETTTLRFCRRSLARRLLEPGEHKYPDLVAHSLAVSRLCWQMALALDFDRNDTEDALLAGLLHDVGMRELDYDRLYRHPAPSSQDRRIYREHVVVGERILKGTGLNGIARAVRHHHERWDGQGYPDRLARDSIPLFARLVHIAEVYDVLTSPESYRPPVASEQALATMRTAAGQQFDADLVRVLARVVR